MSLITGGSPGDAGRLTCLHKADTFQLRQAVASAFRPPVVDYHVLAFDITDQGLAEAPQVGLTV